MSKERPFEVLQVRDGNIAIVDRERTDEMHKNPLQVSRIAGVVLSANGDVKQEMTYVNPSALIARLEKKYVKPRYVFRQTDLPSGLTRSGLPMALKDYLAYDTLRGDAFSEKFTAAIGTVSENLRKFGQPIGDENCKVWNVLEQGSPPHPDILWADVERWRGGGGKVHKR